MKFKTSLKGRLDAEINSINAQLDAQERAEEPEVIVIDGVAKSGLPKSISIKAPWLRSKETDKTDKET